MNYLLFLMWWSFTLLCFYIAASILVGCGSVEYVHVPPTVKTEYTTKLDSIYLYEKDSIYIRAANDTVYTDRWHTRFKDVLRVDTFIKNDSIHVPYPVHHYYEPTWWEQTKMKGFYVFGGVILIWIVVWVVGKKLGVA